MNTATPANLGPANFHARHLELCLLVAEYIVAGDEGRPRSCAGYVAAEEALRRDYPAWIPEAGPALAAERLWDEAIDAATEQAKVLRRASRILDRVAAGELVIY